MELPSVRERRVDARMLTLEALVIVASILAAFALDRWWDARSDRVDERATLQALQSEFLAARAELDFRAAFHGRIVHSIRTTLGSVREAYAQGMSLATVPDTALGWAWITPTTQLALGTLDGLLATGRLSLLRDLELRAALSGWAGVLGELTEEEERALAHVDNQFDPALRRRMDISRFVNNAQYTAQLDGATHAPGFDLTSHVPVDLEVIGVFTMRLAILDHLVDEFPPVFEAADSILALIDRSLGPPRER